MREVSKSQITDRIRFENPWWTENPASNIYHALKPRAYFQLFSKLVEAKKPRRAVLLMGPRRIGKTVMLYQTILKAIEGGANPKEVFYFDLQSPVYNGRGLEELLRLACEANDVQMNRNLLVCFDEIQYLRNWEVHLKSLVDSYPSVKFLGSGSAAAALRLKSDESGAGRFTDFLLPPLTFYEYLDLLNKLDLVELHQDRRDASVSAPDINALNDSFIHYLNFGGYPEAIFSQEIQADPGRFIRSDIIDKVLLKDLPSLYGIEDIQELNSLFATLAYNTADEVSLGALSQNSGVAKNTIKRYIEYLESAFLIRKVHRIDCNARRFKRANFFKVYLTNPSMRSALFAPLDPDSEEMGQLVETAIFAQWFHSEDTELHYARWSDGEVDIVNLGANMKPRWAVEVKWTDAFVDNPGKLKNLLLFCRQHKGCAAHATTRTKSAKKIVDDVELPFLPSALYCFLLGYNIIRSKKVSPVFLSRKPLE